MERWGALDDVVMGGCSESGLYAAPGAGPKDADAVVFSGAVSEGNNGGFASVRSKNYDTPLDLGGYEGLRITCKGDGQRYKLILRTSGAWDAVCYCVSLDTPVRPFPPLVWCNTQCSVKRSRSAWQRVERVSPRTPAHAHAEGRVGHAGRAL